MRVMLICLLFLTACDSLTISPPTITETSPTDEHTVQWEMVTDGIEVEQFFGANTVLRAVRIDPQQYTFRAHYEAANPLTIAEWQTRLPDAQVIINANFFSVGNTVLGLLISDGISYGRTYNDRGGTFFVDEDTVGLVSNLVDPYRSQTYSQAVQAFPMLMINGQAAYQNADDTFPSRRTLIGIDENGYVVIMTTPGFGIGLYPLSQYLPSLNINLDIVMNLDGGGSTMMYIAANESVVQSFDPVPVVLAVYPH